MHDEFEFDQKSFVYQRQPNARFIDPGTAMLASAAISGGASLFGGEDNDVEPLQSLGQLASTKYLKTLLPTTPRFKGGTDFPVEEIAGLTENERMALEKAKQFGSTEAEGLSFLRQLVGDDTSFMESPEIKALIEEVTRIGQQETGRVGRSLQLRGGASSTTGRDILGRSVADTERNVLATLAPYAEQRLQTKVTAAEALRAGGDASILNQLNALSATGGVERQLEQLQKTAEFSAKMQSVLEPTRAASVLAGIPTDHIVTTTESPVSQFLSGAGAGADLFSTFHKINTGTQVS